MTTIDKGQSIFKFKLTIFQIVENNIKRVFEHYCFKVLTEAVTRYLILNILKKVVKLPKRGFFESPYKVLQCKHNQVCKLSVHMPQNGIRGLVTQ